MDSFQQAQIRKALQQSAAAHAAAMDQMEKALSLLSDALRELDEDFGNSESSEATECFLEVDRSLLSVKYDGRYCFLGNTLLFRLLEQLAAHPSKFLSYEDLLAEVWESNRSDGAIRSVVKRLRVALRAQGMDESCLPCRFHPQSPASNVLIHHGFAMAVVTLGARCFGSPVGSHF